MREVHTFDAHGKHAQSVAFTKDGRTLVSVGQDRFVRLWSVPGFEQIDSFTGHQNSVNSIELSPDEKRLATTSSDGTLRVWTFPAGVEQRVVEKIAASSFSPDWTSVGTIHSNGKLTIRNTDDFTVKVEFPQVDKRHFGMAFAPDGKNLLAGGTGSIYVFDIDSGEQIHRLEGHAQAVPWMGFTPDGKWLMSTGAEGNLSIRSAQKYDLNKTVDLGMKGVLQAAIPPAGDTLAISGDHRIQLLSIPEGTLVDETEVSIKGVYGLAISPDGKLLANAGADGKIRIWELE